MDIEFGICDIGPVRFRRANNTNAHKTAGTMYTEYEKLRRG